VKSIRTPAARSGSTAVSIMPVSASNIDRRAIA
jgi:hypothetical protein